MNGFLRKIAENLKVEIQRVGEIIGADYRKKIIHPVKSAAVRIVESDHKVITEKDFPFPGRMQTFANPLTKEAAEKIAEKEKFAKWHADGANRMVDRLNALKREPTQRDWEKEYKKLADERSAMKARTASDAGIPLETPITDKDPNHDWFGNNATSEKTQWDPQKRQYVGGQPTPHNITYTEAAERIFSRFETEGIPGDELQNVVHLLDGTIVNGNRAVRGESLKRAAENLREWNAARGNDVSEWPIPTSGEAMTITGTAADRQRIISDAFRQLATPDVLTVRSWADVAYKLYQSPQTKGGSDAVIRTFLAGAAKYHMGRVPKFPHDIDLLAYTMRQQDFVNYIEKFAAGGY